MKAQPTQAPASPLPKPLVNSVAAKQKRYDEMRRPQAEVLFRALRAAEHKGLAWRECFALTDEPGSVVVWLRSHGVDIEAVYDSGAGETRFYLIEPARPLAVRVVESEGD